MVASKYRILRSPRGIPHCLARNGFFYLSLMPVLLSPLHAMLRKGVLCLYSSQVYGLLVFEILKASPRSCFEMATQAGFR